ncbi:hypothetical protein ScPMuIL_001219 [Solemya velum]
MAELKRMGNACVKHYPPLSKADLQKLYSSMHLATNTPAGGETMHQMAKSSFILNTDESTGLKYVEKKDELSKNHREDDKENKSGVMPECPGYNTCPVTSFLKYLSKLSLECDREKKMKSFMCKWSQAYGLSMVYTNHSIRSTGATILTKKKYVDGQVMAVTGHKSVQSLTVYQQVDTEEKLCMGRSISETIDGAGANLALPVPQAGPVVPVPGPSGQSAMMVIDQLKDVDLGQLFDDFEPTAYFKPNVAPQIFNNCSVIYRTLL